MTVATMATLMINSCIIVMQFDLCMCFCHSEDDVDDLMMLIRMKRFGMIQHSHDFGWPFSAWMP